MTFASTAEPSLTLGRHLASFRQPASLRPRRGGASPPGAGSGVRGLRAGILALGLLACGACGGSSAWRSVPIGELAPADHRALLLVAHDAPGHPDREGCHVSLIPDGSPPAVAEVVDSVALDRALRARGGPPGAHLVLHVDWDSLGAPGATEPIHATLPDSTARTLSELVHGHRTPRTERPGGRTVRRARLRVDLGPEPAYAVGWTTSCAPVLANRAAIQAEVEAAAKTTPSGLFERVQEGGRPRWLPRRTLVYVFVDREGVPAETRIARGSGSPFVDRIALRIGALMRFLPGRMNGRPVAVWVSMPVTLTPGGG